MCPPYYIIPIPHSPIDEGVSHSVMPTFGILSSWRGACFLTALATATDARAASVSSSTAALALSTSSPQLRGAAALDAEMFPTAEAAVAAAAPRAVARDSPLLDTVPSPPPPPLLADVAASAGSKPTTMRFAQAQAAAEATAIGPCSCEFDEVGKANCAPKSAMCMFCMGAAYNAYWSPDVDSCDPYEGKAKDVCKAVAGAAKGGAKAKLEKMYIAFGPQFGATAVYCRDGGCCAGKPSK